MVTIIEGIGHLDSFGVLAGHALASIIFEGASEAPYIFLVEVPRVTYAGF